ncbi:hypothetical protein NRP21_23270 [Roseomonas pecuniae]|uniref:Calcium-binding protein n=2 Tax=Roseomonas populi TaxID=3121582 RepID=A0ABT1XA78_9PROT|nr:hypothetical protein [Roseomonas pecuniae]
MVGSEGNDTYYVEDTGDVVVEKPGEGTDIARVSADWTVSADIEKVILTVAVTLIGNGEANIVQGSEGGDHVLGLGGNDTVNGLGGNDLLEGGEGIDILSGGEGGDTLIGGLGADRLYGNAGADAIRYGSAAEGRDTIYGFVTGEDTIEVSAAGFGGRLEAGILGAEHFTANLTGRATSAAGVGQFVYETDTGRLWWDADGVGGSAGTLLATLSGQPALSASDIHLIA